VKSSPFGDERRGALGELARDQLAVERDRRGVPRITGVEVWPSVTAFVPEHRDRDPVERADPGHPATLGVRPVDVAVGIAKCGQHRSCRPSGGVAAGSARGSIRCADRLARRLRSLPALKSLVSPSRSSKCFHLSMNSGETELPSSRNERVAPRGQTRPAAPDTPELAERRAQAPAAQALIKATRRLFAEGGPEWATDKRIHDTATRPGGRKGFPLGTIRYYFGGREQLLIRVARYEHLSELDRVRRALRSVKTSDALPRTLLRLAEDDEHYQVEFGLLTEARQMADLRAAQAALWQHRLEKLTEMVSDLQQRTLVAADHDPYAVALLWSSITAGLAAHHLANPEIELKPAVALVQLYASALPSTRAARRPSAQ
jgi:AcrR family transcriptional regulator